MKTHTDDSTSHVINDELRDLIEEEMLTVVGGTKNKFQSPSIFISKEAEGFGLIALPLDDRVVGCPECHRYVFQFGKV